MTALIPYYYSGTGIPVNSKGQPLSGGGGGSSYGITGQGAAAMTWAEYPQTPDITKADIYVDPNAATNGDGSLGSPFDNLDSALAIATDGNIIGISAGTLAKQSRYTISVPNLTITGLGSARPIIDRTGPDVSGFDAFAFHITAAGVHLKSLEIVGTPVRTDGGGERGVSMAGGSLLIEDIICRDGKGGSIYAAGVSSVVVQDCIIYNIGDGATSGTNVPDLFVATLGCDDVQYVRCFGANGPDDTFDFWDAINSGFHECASYQSGQYANGNPAGDGNGFKMGGAAGSGFNTIRGSISVAANSQGIVHNSAPNENYYYNNTAVGSGSYGIREDEVPGTLVYENIAIGNGIEHYQNGFVTYRNNTWDLSITDAQFSNPAAYDWSLGAGSPCIGAGQGGINLGASRVALELMRRWANYLENGGARPEKVTPEVS